MYWLSLFAAGILEVVWAYGLKVSIDGSKWPWIVATVVTTVLSLVLLSFSMRQIPLGTAYCIWTGIGAVGTFLVGVFLFAEPATIPRLLCVLLIVSGVVGLRLVS